LPALRQGDRDEVFVTRTYPEPNINQAVSEVDGLMAREKMPENIIRVAPVMTEPHPLVERTQKVLRSTKPDETGLVYPRGGKGCLDIRVAVPNVDRALRIMDAVLKAVETRGYKVSIDEKRNEATTIEVLGEPMEIRLEEGLKRTDHVLTSKEQQQQKQYSWAYAPKYDYHPGGRLALRVKERSEGKRCNWTDRDRRSLEDQLNEFVAGLVQVASIKRARELEWKRQRQQCEEEFRRREEEEQLRQEEAARFKALESDAMAWKRSQLIRDYVGAVRAASGLSGGGNSPESDLGTWIAWALKQADLLDPLAKFGENHDQTLLAPDP